MKRSKVNRIVSSLNKWPSFLQPGIKSFFIGRAVPFVGTSGIRFEKTSETEWIASISNNPRVRNHLKQLHACAMVLLAESIGILIVAMNLPDDKLPLVKSINADFVKRSTGSLRAIVALTNKQIEYIKGSEKGELALEVQLIDIAGIQPVIVTITAAWIPKRSQS